MSQRFVLHRHDSDKPHYDLMLELYPDAPLATYRIGINDIDLLKARKPVKATRIKDHRQKYLDYEGAVGKSRGSVVMIDRGLLENTSDDRVILRGQVLNGHLDFFPARGEDIILTLREYHLTEEP